MGSGEGPIGKATLTLGKREFPVDVYAFKNYRTIFITDDMRKATGKDIEDLPKHARVKNYRGRWDYKAEKFGNPYNKIPSYDFTVDDK